MQTAKRFINSRYQHLMLQLNIDYPNIDYPNIQLSGTPVGSKSAVFLFLFSSYEHVSVLAMVHVHVHMQDMTKTSSL